uniref:Uncharacterized protein n=1 Tax=Glossina pallidipes TaxID=7398 RepID=A0A1B0A3X2_GLOPL
MGFRLMLLMAMGLGAMYMLHLLAQDWNKIRRPLPAAATRLLTSASRNLDKYITRGKRDLRANQMPSHRLDEKIIGKNSSSDNSFIDWKRILSRDPFECLESLICQLVAGAEQSSEDAVMLYDFLEENLSMAPAKVGLAYGRGLALRGSPERCYDAYPFCWYSAKTMLNLLRWLADTVHASDTQQ